MLCLHVSPQRHKRHLLPALLSLNPTPLPILVLRSRSRHPSPVRHLQLLPRRLEQAVDHSNCIHGVSLLTHPVEQADQGAKSFLKPLQFRRCNHAIFRVEEGIFMSVLLSSPTLLFYDLCHHLNLVLHHRIHHHVENGGGYWVSCSIPGILRLLGSYL